MGFLVNNYADIGGKSWRYLTDFNKPIEGKKYLDIVTYSVAIFRQF